MNARPRSLFIVAAEEFGDALGGALIRALQARHGGALTLRGVGGRAMAAAGVKSLFAIDELSIMGIAAIPRRLPMIFRRIRETADAIIAARPDALVIIDSPDFTHRVARRVRRAAPEIPILDYVSPTVWAWRPGRARAMRAYVDQVLAILPFEPALYVKLNGPPCRYVGHPSIERITELRPSAEDAARRRADPPILLVLPGSRSVEKPRSPRYFPRGDPTGGGSDRAYGTRTANRPASVAAAQGGRRRLADCATRRRRSGGKMGGISPPARAALAASGTVTLELALSGVPTVTAYRLSAFEAFIARLLGLLRLPSVILANLVMGENVFPEFIQADCTAENLAGALLPLLSDTPERQRQIEALGRLDGIMEIGSVTPSVQAAAVVLEVAERPR